jgi:sporulation protein YlmC with PRC-barrel domain
MEVGIMFRIGSPVFATDGRVGSLAYVVLDPHTREVSDLIVRCDGSAGERVVSVRYVDHVDADGAVHLGVEKAFVRGLRAFDHQDFETPAWASETSYGPEELLIWNDSYGIVVKEMPQPMKRVHIDRGVDADRVLVGHGSRVYTALGERVGVVDHVVVDADARHLLYLVVRLPGIRRRRVVVAATQVKAWQHDAVVLNLDREALYALPPYVPRKRDEALARRVREVIEALGIAIENLSVFVDRGHVLLRGHSHSQEDRRRIGAAVRGVQGVVGVTNEITTDRELELRAQQRLLEDPVASLYPVDVLVKNRIATVVGKVPSASVQDIILEIVRNTPGILSVVDEIAIDREAFAEETPPIMAVNVQEP